MASGWILPAPQLSKLKNDVVHLWVQSCKGHCVDLSSFEEKYKAFYGIEFLDQYPSLKEWRLLDVMKELKDVISLRESRSSVHIVWNPTSISSPLLPFAGVSLGWMQVLKIFVWYTLYLKWSNNSILGSILNFLGHSLVTPLRIKAARLIVLFLFALFL